MCWIAFFDIVETVTRIEKKQEEQQNLIEKLISQQTEQMQVINDKKQKFDNFLSWDDQQVLLPQNTSLEMIQNTEKKRKSSISLFNFNTWF